MWRAVGIEAGFAQDALLASKSERSEAARANRSKGEAPGCTILKGAAPFEEVLSPTLVLVLSLSVYSLDRCWDTSFGGHLIVRDFLR